MTTRLKLHQRLVEMVNGAAKIYYSPPSNIDIEYPACIYTVDGERTRHADNTKYKLAMSYQVKLILETIESPLLDIFVNNVDFVFVTYYPDNVHHTFVFRTII
jgi:hypothetical protein